MDRPGRWTRVESEWTGPAEVQQARAGSKDWPAGRAEEASGGARAKASRTQEPEWDKTRPGEEALVHMGGN